MKRDIDRTEIPGGSAYNMVDFIPDEIQAVLGGRGGWSYAGSSLSGATQIQGVGYHPDTNKVVAVDQAFALWDVAAASTIGTFSTVMSSAPICPPVYHRGYLIFAQGDGNHSLAQYKKDGTVGNFTSPLAKLVGVYKDHAIAANSAAAGAAFQPQRLWFSAAADPTTWDMTYGWWDSSAPITAIGGVPNCVLIWHGDWTERLRGSTPPPGSDMVLEPFLPNIGCIDPNSVAYWQSNAIWCSSRGIHMTNGISTSDLTDAAGMQTYWQSLMSGYSSSWRIAGGIYRDHYIVSINNGSTLVDCLCVNLRAPAIWRFTNLHGGSFVNVQFSKQEELYMGQWNAGRVVKLASLWSPSGTVKQDGDGTNPTPIVETGMFRGYDRLRRRWIESMGKQKWRFVYIDQDLRDAATDNPTAAVSYCKTPTGSYTQAGLALPASTDVSRLRRSLSPTQGGGTHSQMLGLKYAVTGPYASAKLYTLEGAFEPIEIGAL